MTYPSPFRMHENDLREALSVCLDALVAGADLETCLDLYPALADELRPLLLTAQNARTPHPIPVSADAMHRSRTQTLARAAVLRETRKPFLGLWGWARRVPRFALSSMLTVVVLLTAIFTVNAATSGTLPGDPLYALKLSLESVHMNITPGSQAQEALQEVFRERRIDEVRALLAAGREEMVTFEGVFASKEALSGIAPERWLVSDVYVLRTIDTEVIGEMEIGMLIQVEGRTLSNGYVEATVFRPRAFAFIGLVKNITSNVWTIEERVVTITAETELDEGIGLEDKVMVLAEFDNVGNIYARAILLTGDAEISPTPTPTATPTLEPPVDPTQPSETAQPTPSVTPTPSPSTSPFPSPSPTPEASATPTGDDNPPAPTEAPDATSTDEPENTDEPEETEEPGDDNDNDNDNDNDSSEGG